VHANEARPPGVLRWRRRERTAPGEFIARPETYGAFLELRQQISRYFAAWRGYDSHVLLRGWLRLSCAWLLGSSTLCCQGGYPIAPTLCDDWCNATEHVSCWDYLGDPASCVVSCEQQRLNGSECEQALEAALTCLKVTPQGTDYCSSSKPCGPEIASVYSCASGLPD